MINDRETNIKIGKRVYEAWKYEYMKCLASGMPEPIANDWANHWSRVVGAELKQRYLEGIWVALMCYQAGNEVFRTSKSGSPYGAPKD